MKTKEQNTQNVKGGGHSLPHLKRNRWFLVFFVLFALIVSSFSFAYAYFTATASRRGNFTMGELSLDIVDSLGVKITSQDMATTFTGPYLPGQTISTSPLYVKNTSSYDVYSILKLKIELYTSEDTTPSSTIVKWSNYSNTEIVSGTSSADIITAGSSRSANVSYTLPSSLGNEYIGGKIKLLVKAYAIQKDYMPDDGVHTYAQKAAQYLYEEVAPNELELVIDGDSKSMPLSGATVSTLTINDVTTENSCGWFYDEECTHAAKPTDIVTSDTKLYTKTATTELLSGTSTVSAASTSISGEVVIPKTINGVQVKTVSGFTDCDSITSVTIPTGVTTISSNAFKGCGKLETVNIPNSVTSIGSGAFMNSYLENIDFDDESSLSTITTEMLRYSRITSITIPKSVTTIGANAFTGCGRLATFEFEEGSHLTSILGTQAFYGCSSLESISIPSGVQFQAEQMFMSCSELQTVDLSNCVISNTTMVNMFNGCSSLTDLNLTGLDTSAVTSMNNMFRGCSSLVHVSLSGLDMTAVTNMSYMFNVCSRLETIDWSNVDTSSVTTMYAMFNGCGHLSSVDMSSLNLSAVTNMNQMFQGCSGLTSVKIGSSSNLKSTAQMFKECSSLTSVDFSNFDTSAVTSMLEMFNGCSRMVNLDLTDLDTSSVTNMNSMFRDMSGLVTLDISSFDTSLVTNMGYMFREDRNLVTVYVGANWDTSAVTNSSYMFYVCGKIVGGNGTKYNGSIIDKTRARIDEPGNAGYFTAKS